MNGLAVHTSMWAMSWSRDGAAPAIAAAKTCATDFIAIALPDPARADAAIGFDGGLALEGFVNTPPEMGHGLPVWRPVVFHAEDVIGRGLPFLRNKAAQYGLI